MMDHAHADARDGLAAPRRGFPSPMRLLAVAAWVGLLTGLAELVILAIREARGGAVTIEMLWDNRHSGWMIPASNLAIFSLAALACSLLARARPKMAAFVAGPLIAALAIVGLSSVPKTG